MTVVEGSTGCCVNPGFGVFFNFFHRPDFFFIIFFIDQIVQKGEVFVCMIIASRPSAISKIFLHFPARGRDPTGSVHSHLKTEWPQKALNIPCAWPVASRTFLCGLCTALIP